MKPLRKLLLALTPVLALFAFTVSQLPALAAPTANLLKGKNPSFEKGLKDWMVFEVFTNTIVTKTVNDSASPACGQKAFMAKSNENDAFLSNVPVPMAASTQYKVTVWLKLKGTGRLLRISASEGDPNNPSNTTNQLLVDNITTTDGKWQKFTGTFNSLSVPGTGQVRVSLSKGPGKVYVDCVSIKPV
jgi:hypothetical protein